MNWELILPWATNTIVLAVPLLVALLAAMVAHWLLLRILSHSKTRWQGLGAYLLPRIPRPLGWALVLLALSIALGFTEFHEDTRARLRQFTQPALIAVIIWLAVRIILAVADWLSGRFTWEGVEDNLAARRLSTQLRVFRNIAVFFVIVIGAIVIAMGIPALRNLGISLFASAGVAGLVVGMAARPALSNLIAGVQLALAQPIRLDDVVIVEGEWGRIQEITATFVVVNIWDQRRLIVPLSYFIEHPFQNWTHTTSQLLGTAYLYLDYTVPVEAIREELTRILESAKQWDKRVAVVQVTDLKESATEVRVLVSARNSGELFDLRCIVREKLIAFLQREYPASLPRMRAELMKAA